MMVFPLLVNVVLLHYVLVPDFYTVLQLMLV